MTVSLSPDLTWPQPSETTARSTKGFTMKQRPAAASDRTTLIYLHRANYSESESISLINYQSAQSEETLTIAAANIKVQCVRFRGLMAVG